MNLWLTLVSLLFRLIIGLIRVLLCTRLRSILSTPSSLCLTKIHRQVSRVHYQASGFYRQLVVDGRHWCT